METVQLRHTLEEADRLATKWYEQVVKPSLRPEDAGLFYAIDVDTGTFVLDPDEIVALDLLRERVPDAYPFLGRVGWPAADRIGGFGFDGQIVWSRDASIPNTKYASPFL